MNNETCPKCGAELEYTAPRYQRYLCGSAMSNKFESYISEKCYKRQLGVKDAEIERLKQAFKTYGWHTEDCDNSFEDCFCGFDEVK